MGKITALPIRARRRCSNRAWNDAPDSDAATEAKEQKRRTFPQNLSIRIRQANASERVLPASRAPFHSGRKARLTSQRAFPGGRSNLLLFPSSFPRPSTRSPQWRPLRSEQLGENPATLFAAIL